MRQSLRAIVMRLGRGALFIAWACSSIGCGPLQPDPAQRLVNAAGRSKEEVVELLRKGADVDARSRRTFGWTPLISAIYHRRADIVGLLIEAGADVNLRDGGEGTTPISWAVTIGDTNLIQSLILAGADPRLTNRLGGDAYSCARTKENVAAIWRTLDSASPSKALPRRK